MSSPAASASGDRKNPAEQITFRFCSECSNMLYPKEDEVERKLMFTCRTCNFSEEATSSCIFRNSMNNAAGETAGVTQDVGSDPTVGSFSSSFGDGVVSDRRDSGSSGHSGSSSSSACAISSCVGCGVITACGNCGDRLSMIPLATETPTPGLDFDKLSVTSPDHDAESLLGDHELDVDLDDVEIVAWSGDSLDELAAMFSFTDCFGLGDMDIDADQKPTNVPVFSALPFQAAFALSEGSTL